VDDQLQPFVERVRSGEVVDAVADLARGIPTLVIASMLGIETSMFKQFSAWSDAMGAIPEGALDPTERGTEIVLAGRQATAELNAYIADQVQDRRRNGGDDLIAKMVGSDYARTAMTDAEIIASNTQLVFAGNETTAKLMAHTLVTLARHPDQRRLLAADHSLVAPALEEVLRWETITQFIDRDVRDEPVTLGDVVIPPGSVVTPLQGAANRDPERWEQASEFDITRTPRQHLGFGFGMHSCIGLNLARMEAQVWLDRLLDELPDYELAGEIGYGGNFQLRGPEAVPIALP
jgi:cytochrome P450